MTRTYRQRLLWPGIVFVLVGSLVLLHAATLVFACTADLAGPGVAAGTRPRAGWQVDVGSSGDGRLTVTLADASGHPIDDASVSVRVAGRDVPMRGGEHGRYAGEAAGGPTARVRVERRGTAWTFDRPVRPVREGTP